MAMKGLKGQNIKRKKPTKKVELTESQRIAMEARMKKLREARKAKRGNKSPQHVHPSVLARPAEDKLSYDNVREWQKHCKELMSSYRPLVRQKTPGAFMKYEALRGYVSDIDHYIRTGDWISNYYGKEMQSRTRWKPITNVGVEDFFTNNKRFVDGKVLELEEYLEAKQEGRV